MLFLTKSLTRIPSSTVSMFIPDEVNKGKSQHAIHLKSPFLLLSFKPMYSYIKPLLSSYCRKENVFYPIAFSGFNVSSHFAIEPLKVDTGAILVTSSSSSITAPKASIIDLDAYCSSQAHLLLRMIHG